MRNKSNINLKKDITSLAFNFSTSNMNNLTVAQAQEIIAAGKGFKQTLVCKITGKSRATSAGYMANKKEGFADNYVCKEAAQLLRAGKDVNFIREVFKTADEVPVVTQEEALAFLAWNGKQKK